VWFWAINYSYFEWKNRAGISTFLLKNQRCQVNHPRGSLPCRQTGSLRAEWQGILRNETTKDGHQSMVMNIFEK
jgi:hypothetical protein